MRSKRGRKARAHLLQLGEDVRQALVLERRDVVDEPPHVPREVKQAGVAHLSKVAVGQASRTARRKKDEERGASVSERGSERGERASERAHLEDHGAVAERASVHVVLGELGQLDEHAHHDGRDVVDQVLQVRTRLVGGLRRGRLRRRPRVLGLLEEVVDLLRDLRDHAVLRLLERLLERGERVEVDRAAALGRPIAQEARTSAALVEEESVTESERERTAG